MWFSIYVTATGRLLAHSSVLPDVINGAWTVQNNATRQDQDNVWDQPSRSWATRPAPVVVDRLGDLANNAFVADVWSNMTPARRIKLRKLIVWLLGTRRFRTELEAVSLDVDDVWPGDPAAVNE